MINTNTVSTRREENSIISVRKMCVVALAIVLNVIGGQIAKSLDLFDLRTEVPFLRAANLDDAALRGLNAWLKLGQENCLMKES